MKAKPRELRRDCRRWPTCACIMRGNSKRDCGEDAQYASFLYQQEQIRFRDELRRKQVDGHRVPAGRGTK